MGHVLIVPNMVGQACANLIEETVHALDSAAHVEADLSAQMIRVDTGKTSDAVRRTLLDEGFPTHIRAA